MKRILCYVGMTTILLLTIISCSKKDSLPDQNQSPPIVLEPAPKGTAIATSPSIIYNRNDTIDYSFTGATQGVWVNNIFQGLSQTGRYITDSLKSSTTFIVTAKSKDSTTNLSVPITVGQDQRVTFLIQGNFRCDSILARPYNLGTPWFKYPGYCNTFTFYWDGFTAAPGNREITTSSGTCTDPAGINGESKWYFIGETGFSWHGINNSTITFTANGFQMYYHSVIIWGGVPVDGEFIDFYTRN